MKIADMTPEAVEQLRAAVFEHAGIKQDLHSEEEWTDELELFDIACKIRDDGGQHDTLIGAYESGPLFDGDVPSKTSRDVLVELGAMTRVIVKGESGFNACTYVGACIYKLIQSIKAVETGTVSDNP